MPDATVACPVCQEPMHKESIPQGVEIDFCDAHGVWLDAGELEAIIQAEQDKAPTAATGRPGGAAGGAVAAAIGAAAAGSGMRALIRMFFGRRW